MGGASGFGALTSTFQDVDGRPCGAHHRRAGVAAPVGHERRRRAGGEPAGRQLAANARLQRQEKVQVGDRDHHHDHAVSFGFGRRGGEGRGRAVCCVDRPTSAAGVLVCFGHSAVQAAQRDRRGCGLRISLSRLWGGARCRHRDVDCVLCHASGSPGAALR